MKSESRVWLVTGASSGFGMSLALEALSRGDRVVATARDTATLRELVERSEGRAVAVQLDVTDRARLPVAFTESLAAFGRIDVLVNNAGYSMVGAVEETSDDELRGALETMFFGAAALTRLALPVMRAQRSGTIVQITSVGGLVTAPGFGAYCAAKHALEALSESLAAEVAPFGIRVLVVEPGAFRTRLFGSGFRRMPEMAEYEATVGPTRAYAASSHGAQGGDPDRAARAIADAVVAPSATFRLPLGGDAVDGIRAQLARVGAEVDRVEAVARATAFDA